MNKENQFSPTQPNSKKRENSAASILPEKKPTTIATAWQKQEQTLFRVLGEQRVPILEVCAEQFRLIGDGNLPQEEEEEQEQQNYDPWPVGLCRR